MIGVFNNYLENIPKKIWIGSTIIGTALCGILSTILGVVAVNSYRDNKKLKDLLTANQQEHQKEIKKLDAGKIELEAALKEVLETNKDLNNKLQDQKTDHAKDFQNLLSTTKNNIKVLQEKEETLNTQKTKLEKELAESNNTIIQLTEQINGITATNINQLTLENKNLKEKLDATKQSIEQKAEKMANNQVTKLREEMDEFKITIKKENLKLQTELEKCDNTKTQLDEKNKYLAEKNKKLNTLLAAAKKNIKQQAEQEAKKIAEDKVNILEKKINNLNFKIKFNQMNDEERLEHFKTAEMNERNIIPALSKCIQQGHLQSFKFLLTAHPDLVEKAQISTFQELAQNTSETHQLMLGAVNELYQVNIPDNQAVDLDQGILARRITIPEAWGYNQSTELAGEAREGEF